MADVLKFRLSGSDNMAEVVPPAPPGGDWALVSVEVHFSRASGSGTSTAALTLSRFREADEKFNTELYSIAAAGDANDVALKIGDDERRAWSFEQADQVKVSWTNPDSGNLWWGLTVGYMLLSDA